MPIVRTLDQNFFKKWSPDMAYVLGYFAADGSMIRNNRGAYFIEFTSTDKILLDQVQKVVQSNHKLTVRQRGGNCKTAYRLQIGSIIWHESLTQLGFTAAKSNTLQFPSVPSTYLPDFVRGYFDGDGCVYFKHLKYADRSKKRWVLQTLFTSGSRIFLETLHTRLREHDVRKGSVQRKQRGFELIFSHRDSLALYKLMYHTGQTSNMFLPRKRSKLERAVTIFGYDKSLRS